MTKWTKKDIRALCSALDTFVLLRRPPSNSVREHAEAAEQSRQAIEKHRKDIVLADLRAWRARSADRYRQYCETIGNQIVRFTRYGDPDELIERFTALAREEDAEEKRAEALVLRVVREGLPPEVEAYDPLAR